MSNLSRDDLGLGPEEYKEPVVQQSYEFTGAIPDWMNEKVMVTHGAAKNVLTTNGENPSRETISYKGLATE